MFVSTLIKRSHKLFEVILEKMKEEKKTSDF